VRVAAVELGGSHVAAGRVDLDTGTVAQQRRALDSGASREELVERIRDVAVAAAVGAERLGVAAPGPFDYESGVARMTHKLPALFGVDLRRELADALRLEPGAIRFLNDAGAFLLGEWLTGAARGAERVLGVTLGTGLGSAFLVRGELEPAPDLYRLAFRGRPVEEAISARGISAAYDGNVRVAEIAARARGGDGRALDAFQRLGDDLGQFLVPHVERLAADRLVVGGAIAGAWDLFEAALHMRVAAAVPAGNAEDAALVGAAHYAV
jgi:glucokinase